jgi:hypothetical protein
MTCEHYKVVPGCTECAKQLVMDGKMTVNAARAMDRGRQVLGDVTAMWLHGVRIPVNNDQELFDLMMAVNTCTREAEDAGYPRSYFEQRLTR